jgi:hypothetical protein
MCAGKALATLIFVCLTATAIVSYIVANNPGVLAYFK